jgi:hypothetical protein
MSRSCGGGRFVRDDRGVWRYGAHGQPVSGAQDMTLSNFFNFVTQERAGGEVVEVLRGVALEDRSLEFCLDFDTGVGSAIDVPLHIWDQHDEVIGIWAPELKEEGGMRGMKFDAGGGSDWVWQAPVAPTKPHDIHKMAASLRRHLRRKGWAPQEVNGFSVYWEPWRENPRESGPRFLPEPD